MANLSSIQTLTELSIRASEQAVTRLGQANQEHARAVDKLKVLQNYHQSYAQQMQMEMAKGLNLGAYHNYVGFLASLEQAVNQQQQDVARKLQQVELQRREWQHCERQRLSYATLRDRMLQQQQQQANRREQKLNDEFAERSFRRML